MFWLLLAVALDGVFVAGSPIESRLGSIETEIRRLMDERDIPSYGVAIIDDGEVVFSRSFGFARRETKEPATPETLYNVGSVTKTFTASLLMILRDRGLPRRPAPRPSCHGGEVDGHSSYVSFSPPQRLGIVVLANLGGPTADELGVWLQRELHGWN